MPEGSLAGDSGNRRLLGSGRPRAAQTPKIDDFRTYPFWLKPFWLKAHVVAPFQALGAGLPEGQRVPMFDARGRDGAVQLGAYGGAVSDWEDGLREGIVPFQAFCGGIPEVKLLSHAKLGRDLGNFEGEQVTPFEARGAARTVVAGRGVAFWLGARGDAVSDFEDGLGEAISLLQARGSSSAVEVLVQTMQGRGLVHFEDEQEPRFVARGAAWRVMLGRGIAAQQGAYGDAGSDLDDGVRTGIAPVCASGRQLIRGEGHDPGQARRWPGRLCG